MGEISDKRIDGGAKAPVRRALNDGDAPVHERPEGFDLRSGALE
jgi:hypothetical protein